MAPTGKRQKLFKDESDDGCAVWPSKDPSTTPKLPGLLAGLDDDFWNAMWHVKFIDDKGTIKKCQVVVREALVKIGMGWYATNTNPYRRAFGKPNKYAIALQMWGKNRWMQPPHASQTPPKIKKVKLIDNTNIKKCYTFEGSGDDSIIKQKDIQKIKDELKTNGVVLIRNACANLPNDDASLLEEETKGKKQIRNTTGNGIGPSYYVDAKSNYWTDVVQNSILKSWLSNEEFQKIRNTKKAILLRYGKGSENFAHQDGNICRTFPYQATVIMSDPQQDYEGGEFYVSKKEEATPGRHIIRRRIVAFQSKGDMVLFRATPTANDGGDQYYHGMMTVTKGTRVAVGLFQAK